MDVAQMRKSRVAMLNFRRQLRLIPVVRFSFADGSSSIAFKTAAAIFLGRSSVSFQSRKCNAGVDISSSASADISFVESTVLEPASEEICTNINIITVEKTRSPRKNLRYSICEEIVGLLPQFLRLILEAT